MSNHQIKHYIKIVILCITVLLSLFFLIRKLINRIEPEDFEKEYISRPDNTKILFIGSDISGSLNGLKSQGDFIYLLTIHKDDYFGLLLNRDSMVDINVFTENGSLTNDITHGQLALAYGYGNSASVRSKSLKFTVENLIDTDIDYYINLNSDGLIKLVDTIGGVEVIPDSDYSDIIADMEIDKPYLLDGINANSFIRSRMNVQDGTNVNRMERQQLFIEALIKKMNDTEFNEQDIYDIFTDLSSDDLAMNLTVQRIKSIYDNLKEKEFIGTKTIDGKADYSKDIVEFEIDEDSLNEIKSLYR